MRTVSEAPPMRKTPMEQIAELVSGDRHLCNITSTALAQISECIGFSGDEPTDVRTGKKMDMNDEIKTIYSEVGREVRLSSLSPDVQGRIKKIIDDRLADPTPLPKVWSLMQIPE